MVRVTPVFNTIDTEIATWSDYCIVPDTFDLDFSGIFDEYETYLREIVNVQLDAHDLQKLQGSIWTGTRWQLLEERSSFTPDIIGSGPNLPVQCAVVLTLDDPTVTPAQKPHRRNRRYLGPLAVGVINDNGKITVTQQNALLSAYNSLAERWADLFDPLGAWPGPAVEAPPAGYDTWGAGIFSPTLAEGFSPKRYRLGSVIDTQRRRRNGLIESYEEIIL